MTDKPQVPIAYLENWIEDEGVTNGLRRWLAQLKKEKSMSEQTNEYRVLKVPPDMSEERVEEMFGELDARGWYICAVIPGIPPRCVFVRELYGDQSGN